MPKELFLSVGLQKTASTSIQQTCFSNPGRLRKAGFVYPRYSLQGIPKESSNHTTLLRVMFQERKEARGYLAECLSETAATPLLVAEGVSLFGEETLREMRDWFISQDWELKVVCHVRHVSSWVHSMVGQRVAGHLRTTIANPIETFIKTGALVRKRLERIRSVFPDTRFYSHETALNHPEGPAGFFLENLGVPLEGINFKTAREGRSDCAVRVMSVMNEHFHRDDPQAQAAAEFLKAIPGPKFRLREAEAAPLLPMIEAENQWLRETFGDEFHGPAMAYGPVDWTDEGRAHLVKALEQMPPAIGKWLVAHRSRWAGAAAAAQGA